MRLRVLELPSQPDVTVDTYRIPFVLIFDQVGAELTADRADLMTADLTRAARQIGAEGVLLFPNTVDLVSDGKDGDDEEPEP